MPQTQNLEVALTRKLCLICNKTEDDGIVLNKTLTKKHADQVRELHGKVTSAGICDDCKIDGVYIVEVDEEKTTDKKDPYRTGRIVGVTHEGFERMFKDVSPDKGLCYMGEELFEQMFGHREFEDA